MLRYLKYKEYFGNIRIKIILILIEILYKTDFEGERGGDLVYKFSILIKVISIG